MQRAISFGSTNEEAQVVFAQALRKDPELVHARIGMASALVGLRRYSDARIAYETAHWARPDMAAPLYGLAETHRALGDMERARYYYSAYLQSTGSDKDANLEQQARREMTIVGNDAQGEPVASNTQSFYVSHIPVEYYRTLNPETILGFIKYVNLVTGELIFEKAEWISSEDVERIKELVLDLEWDLPNDFYIHIESDRLYRISTTHPVLVEILEHTVQWFGDPQRCQSIDLDCLASMVPNPYIPFWLSVEIFAPEYGLFWYPQVNTISEQYVP